MNLIIENVRSEVIPVLPLPTLEHVTMMPTETTETINHIGKTPEVFLYTNTASLTSETDLVGNTYV